MEWVKRVEYRAELDLSYRDFLGTAYLTAGYPDSDFVSVQLLGESVARNLAFDISASIWREGKSTEYLEAEARSLFISYIDECSQVEDVC